MIFWIGNGRPGCCGCVSMLVLLFVLTMLFGGSCGVPVPSISSNGPMW